MLGSCRQKGFYIFIGCDGKTLEVFKQRSDNLNGIFKKIISSTVWRIGCRVQERKKGNQEALLGSRVREDGGLVRLGW